jgi:apoptosis-inducing factor 2
MKKKVVVIGGGFAGSYVAKRLEKVFDITLIDTKDYFEFTPGVLRTIVEPEHIRNIQVLHTDYLKQAKVILGKVDKLGKGFIKLKDKKINYDYLVVASGSSYEAPFKDQEIVIATRGKMLRNYFNSLKEAKKILIIGGGVVGVEMAGEICSKYDDKEVTVVHAKKRLIDRNFKKAIDYAEKILRKKNVKILFNERVEGKKEEKWITNKGRKIEADIVFLCTGIKANYSFIPKKYLGRMGIKVDRSLRVVGMKNVFAIGDVNSIREEKTAQNAERQARVLCKNITNLDLGKKLIKYKTKNGLMLISLGKYSGILSKGNFVIGGIIPAIMKSGVERWKMWNKRRTE